MRVSRALLLPALALCASTARAWQDPFASWTAGGYAQFLEINRPAGGLPPAGNLDAWNDAAGGYTRDGLGFRIADVRLSGPLGFPGFSAAMESQAYLGTASLTDCYTQWDTVTGRWRLGQVYLPFGLDLQTSYRDLCGVQRDLVYGFENYGHVQPWGLQLMNQRGMGLRWDGTRPLAGPLSVFAGGGAQLFNGGDLYLNAAGGIARLGARWQAGDCAVQAAFSALEARATLQPIPSDFVPLGAPEGAAFQPTALDGGKARILSWGPDALADCGPLHGRAELALQSLHGLLRGGGEATARLDLDWLLRRLGAHTGWTRAYVYAKWDQAWTRFGDGVHAPDSLYRTAAYGLRLPLGWPPASLKLESLNVGNDAYGSSLPDGRITQAQLQVEL
jgi:hypothetical protein